MVYLRNWEDEKIRLAGVARLSRALVKIAPLRGTRRRCGAAADPVTGQAAGGETGLARGAGIEASGRSRFAV
jgi:hypothetical protein